MAHYRITEAAAVLGVSDDTVRRWVDAGTLPVDRDEQGRRVIDGVALAARAIESAQAPDDPTSVGRSARNRFPGIVTRVLVDGVMAQVEVQSGRHGVVSLLSAEAVRELGLEVGSPAVAVVKATSVLIETPR